MRILKVMPSDLTRCSREDNSVYLFLLTSQIDDGAIDLLPEVFMGQIQIQIIGIGPIFWARTRWGLGSCVFS